MIRTQFHSNRRIARPALRYHGSKWKMASWIISYFPAHVTYVELFGGSASVLLQKNSSKIEVYNDINQDVVNFFKVLREHPDELIRSIELTPFSRTEFLLSQKPCSDELERARRFYVWSWQGRGRAGVIEPGGWRFMARATRYKTPVEDWLNSKYLWQVVDRLRQVHIECDDALKVITRFDDSQTLFYVDPPYVQSTRSYRWRRDGYKYELTDEDHTRLAERMHDVQGMVIVSGYRCELYDHLYHDWIRMEKRSLKEHGKIARECIWISKNIHIRQPSFKEVL